MFSHEEQLASTTFLRFCMKMCQDRITDGMEPGLDGPYNLVERSVLDKMLVWSWKMEVDDKNLR